MNRLREFRKKCGLTQQELAEKSGVSRATITRIEQGASMDVRLCTLLALSNAVGHSVAEIFLPQVTNKLGRKRA